MPSHRVECLSKTYCPAITPSVHKLDLLGSELTAPMVHKQSKLLTVHFGVAQLKTKGLLSLLSPLFDCMEESPFGLLADKPFQIKQPLDFRTEMDGFSMMHFTEPTPTPSPASGRELVCRSQQINILGWRTGHRAGQKFQDNLVFNMFQG